MPRLISEPKKFITVVAPSGVLSPQTLQAIADVAREYALEPYITTTQNVRLLGIDDTYVDAVRDRLVAAGAVIKTPGRFPKPKVCVGTKGCKLGLVDAIGLGNRIVAHFSGWQEIKPKLKIALAACPASCSGALLVDIGIVATKAGYDIYVGGKGGPFPKKGRRIVRRADEARVLEVLATVVAHHNRKTRQKQRLVKEIDEPDFPFPPEV